MKRGPELRDHTESAAVALAVAGDDVAGNEGAGEAVAIDRAVGGPGEDRLVTHVFVDFCPGLQRGVGHVAEEFVQKLVEPDRSQPLGQAGRILHIDQQEHPLLALGLDVAADQQALQGAVAQQAADLDDNVGKDRHGDREDE